MKSFLSYKCAFSLLFVAFVAVFVSCDQIGEGERYIAVTPVDTAGADTTGGVVPIRRAVLVEEFSGQLCVNCPAASEALEAMQEANGGPERIVVVSIHAGVGNMLAINQAMGQALRVEGLATDFGEQLYSHYGLSSEPNAVIDRRSGVVSQPQWLTTIINSLSRDVSVGLSLRTDYDSESRQLTVDVLGRTSGQGAYYGNVHVWLTEDSIVTMQRLSGGGYDYSHVFNSIFRASATPMAGEQVSIMPADEVQPIYTASVTLEGHWRPEKMAVVAFVDDASGVANVARAALLPAIDAGEADGE